MLAFLISNTLVKIRNASLSGKRTVSVPLSNFNVAVIKVLKDEGYIRSFTTQKTNNHFAILVRFNTQLGRRTIRNIRQLTWSGSRTYTSHKDLQRSERTAGITIVSTPKGLMTKRSAAKLGVGGEVICSVT